MSIVFAGLRTRMVTLWTPRIADSGSNPSATQGVRLSRVVAMSSNDRPDGSPNATAGSPNRGSMSATATPRALNCARHESSEPTGTENEVTVTCPAPFRPAGTPRPAYGNVVQIVPGTPRSLPP